MSFPGSRELGTNLQRLAFHVINMPMDQVEQLAQTIVDARKNVRYCKVCCTLTDREVCPICSNPDRDKKTIMVVETSRIWRRMRRRENIMVSIMCCTGQISPMLGSSRDIRLKD
mgnify:CR=1 FL=1